MFAIIKSVVEWCISIKLLKYKEIKMSLATYNLNLNKDNHDDIKWEMVNELSSPMYKYLDQAKIDLIEELISDSISQDELEDYYYTNYGE
jgi:hypothetical protein